MDNLLNTEYITYINSLKKHIPPCNGIAIRDLKSDVIDDKCFDIKDKQISIKQPIGKGSVTYKNDNSKIIAFIDYESFIDLIAPYPSLLTKDIKRCDFIAYEIESDSFFILNELSESKRSNDKFNKARQQLHDSAMHLSRCSTTKKFIDLFNKKTCVFSNKTQPIRTPDNIADAFSVINNYLPEPIIHSYQPIEKLGFEFIETSIVEL